MTASQHPPAAAADQTKGRPMRTSRRVLTGITIGVVTGGVAGGLMVATASAGILRSRAQDPAPTYAHNSSGLTYGSGLDATKPGNQPDLTQAYGDNGVLGYVRTTDLNPPDVKNPTAAAALARAGVAGRDVPLYAQDGKTVIGRFHLGAVPAH